MDTLIANQLAGLRSGKIPTGSLSPRPVIHGATDGIAVVIKTGTGSESVKLLTKEVPAPT